MCGEGVRSIFLIAFCDYMPRDNRCMYMTHVCFYVCCSDSLGVCEVVCYVTSIIKYIFFSTLDS